MLARLLASAFECDVESIGRADVVEPGNLVEWTTDIQLRMLECQVDLRPADTVRTDQIVALRIKGKADTLYDEHRWSTSIM